MRISENVEIIDLGIVTEGRLVISDLHLGFQESLQKQGFLVPYRNKLLKRLEAMLRKAKPHTVIIDGDLKHAFGAMQKSEWKETQKVVDLLRKHAKLLLVQGNHDTLTQPILDRFEAKMQDHVYFDGTYICHGHNLPDDKDFKRSKRVIIGHVHPCITLRQGSRRETYKCFLRGKQMGKDIYVLPSCNFFTDGSDILEYKSNSPIIKKLDDFEVFVVGDPPYFFGKVSDQH